MISSEHNFSIRLQIDDNKNAIIVIDSLCDAEIHKPDHGPTISSFLAQHLSAFPSWLKIIATIRTPMAETAKSLPFHRINLDKTDVDERLNKDMQNYIFLRVRKSPEIQANITPKFWKPNSDQRQSPQMESEGTSISQGGPQDQLSQFLVRAAAGNFLYVKMVLDLIQRGKLVVKSASFKVIPLSLSEIYQLEFNLKFSSLKAFEKVEDILSVIVASLVPLTPLDIYNATNALRTASIPKIGQESENLCVQWGEFLMRFASLGDFLYRYD